MFCEAAENMSKLFYIIGKSATGKDSIYRELMNMKEFSFQKLILYTTRPMRDGEENGREYFFVSEDDLLEMKRRGVIIEERDYQTVHGVWVYFTADDGQIRWDGSNYLGIGTLESYCALKDYYGQEKVCPIYIEVEDGERLARALKREMKPENGRYAEMCRRFLADAEDFSEEKLKEAGITMRFINDDKEECLKNITEYIRERQ